MGNQESENKNLKRQIIMGDTDSYRYIKDVIRELNQAYEDGCNVVSMSEYPCGYNMVMYLMAERKI